jgi:hypothetical protein
MTDRPFREWLWDPQPGDVRPLYAGLRRFATMRVVSVEPHRLVTEEAPTGGGVPVLRFYAHADAFARAYRVTADPYAMVYASDA